MYHYRHRYHAATPYVPCIESTEIGLRFQSIISHFGHLIFSMSPYLRRLAPTLPCPSWLLHCNAVSQSHCVITALRYSNPLDSPTTCHRSLSIISFRQYPPCPCCLKCCLLRRPSAYQKLSDFGILYFWRPRLGIPVVRHTGSRVDLDMTWWDCCPTAADVGAKHDRISQQLSILIRVQLPQVLRGPFVVSARAK